MGRWAGRGANKIMKRCPFCGSRRPKENVEGPKRLNLVGYIGFTICTCGLGIVTLPLFRNRYLEAYCEDCGRTFTP